MQLLSETILSRAKHRPIGARTPQVPNLDSQAAGFRGAQSALAGMPTVKADPGDGYLERMVKYPQIIAFSMVINAILHFFF